MVGRVLFFLSAVLASSSDRCSIALHANMTIKECHNLDFVVQYPPKGGSTCSREFVNRTLALISSMNSTLDYVKKYVDAATIESPETEKLGRMVLLRKILNDVVQPEVRSAEAYWRQRRQDFSDTALAGAVERMNQKLEINITSFKPRVKPTNQTEMKPRDLLSLHWPTASEYLLRAKRNWENMTNIFDHLTDFHKHFAKHVKQMEHANTCHRILQGVSNDIMLDFTEDNAGIKYVNADMINSTCGDLLNDEHGAKAESASSMSDRCEEYDRQLGAQHRQLLQSNLNESETRGAQHETQTCLNDLKHFELIPHDCELSTFCVGNNSADNLLLLCKKVETLFELQKANETQGIPAWQHSTLADSQFLEDKAKLVSESKLHCVDELLAVFDAYKANVEMKGKVKSCAGMVDSDVQNRIGDCKRALKLVLEWEAYPIRNLIYLLKVPRRCIFLEHDRVVYIYVSSAAVVFAAAVLLGCFGSCVQCCFLLFRSCKRCCKRHKNNKSRSFSSSSSEV